jgi:hypothetical protein
MIDWMQTGIIICTMLMTAYYIHRDIIADMRVQSARTDKLYGMFIDLLKSSQK